MTMGGASSLELGRMVRCGVPWMFKVNPVIPTLSFSPVAQGQEHRNHMTGFNQAQDFQVEYSCCDYWVKNCPKSQWLKRTVIFLYFTVRNSGRAQMDDSSTPQGMPNITQLQPVGKWTSLKHLRPLHFHVWHLGGVIWRLGSQGLMIQDSIHGLFGMDGSG